MGKSLLGVAGISLAVALASSEAVADGVSDERLSQDFFASSFEHRAATQLINSQLSSGYFPYDYSFVDGSQSSMDPMEGFNLVRQAAAAFGLAQYHAAFQSDESRSAVERFLHTAEKHSLSIGKASLQDFLEQKGVYNRWQLWGPLRQPLYAAGLLFAREGRGQVLSVAGDYELAWTGATALSLLTAVSYYRATGDPRFNSAIEHWKKGLLALHVRGRGFRVAPHYMSETAYFNGESWLALAEYTAVFPQDADTAEILNHIDDYMIDRYGGKPDKYFYTWGTMAAAARANSTQNPRFVDFAMRLARDLLKEPEIVAIEGDNSCDLVEGLATFVVLMRKLGRKDDPLLSVARNTIATLMTTNRQLQVEDSSSLAWSVPPQQIPALDHYQGAFVLSFNEPIMRIDLTMHCLNAALLIAPIEQEATRESLRLAD
jgi:hypothetical protein